MYVISPDKEMSKYDGVDLFPVMVSTLPGWADVTLLRAAARAGSWAVLNLEAVTGDDARTAFAALAHDKPGRIGVRITDATFADWPTPLLGAIDFVVIGTGAAAQASLGRFNSGVATILFECTSIDDARTASELTVDGLIAKGHEAGGCVGEETTFVLLQRLLALSMLPVWAHGGVGVHTIGACAVAGCAGIVLDSQLTLARESTLPDSVKTVIGRLSGDETICVAGAEPGQYYRLLSRRAIRMDESAQLRASVAGAGESAGAADPKTAKVDGHPQPNWKGNPPLWPIGQDAAFAFGLARRFRSIAGMLHGLRQAIDSHIADARQLCVLGRGGPLAVAHGTDFPILQGPMTRVSDTPAFADAVARSGGLPFLACALLRAPQLEALLHETGTRLGLRPWGVGILGFVPLELREEQLRVIQEFKPPFAIVAGGRPDQAAALEKQGIQTYLHVPAPALLRMFLADGARRFIFEGRECGGHVGPRTSFVLWQSMVEVLLEAIDGGVRGEDLHVVFAGGIHDERSAAMVAAIGSPLARRGVRIGVLIGTAYLFTHEAVESGAVVRGFQEEALTCSRTVLLESGPGHATRCADTPFCTTFQDTRRRLIAEGGSPDQVRFALEALNLGRLRIASKGVVRPEPPAASEVLAEPPKYIALTEDEQRREGMYMIGQVAALRDRLCRIADLHESVSTGSVKLLNEVRLTGAAPAAVERRPATALSTNIAIVGMGCLLPKATDLRTLWSNLLNKVDAIEEIPGHRFDAARYYDPDRRAVDKIYSKWGGFLDEVAFDPLKYGIPPAAVPSIDPFQLLTLEVVYAALRDAGYADREFDRERTSVILGASGGVGDLGFRYGIRAGLPMYLDHVPEKTLAQLPSWTEDSFSGVLPNVAAGRVANRLDLGGLNFTVDAACASSLAAVYVAARELESGTSDMVLVGGIDTVNSPFGYLCFSSAQALSPTGRCCTFDERADGIAISEGIVVLVLKREPDAVRDGDRIYSVIRAVAGSSDGRGKGLTAPKPEGQMRVLQRAYAAAGFSPATVGLVEAHGTGTVAGDSAEAGALSRVFGDAGASPASCALGSIKSMIGHTKSAAGVSGLMKVALALHHKVLPPTLHVTTPNAQLRAASTPFYLNTEARPWIARNAVPRRAAVSSFGFGGTNFHVVAEEYDAGAPGTLPGAPAVESWPSELSFWAASSMQDLVGVLDGASEALTRAKTAPLRDLAAAVCRVAPSPSSTPIRVAIVARSVPDLVEKIAEVRAAAVRDNAQSDPERGIYFGRSEDPRGKVGFLFPGQGSQYPGMFRELAVYFHEIRHALEVADRATTGCFPKPLSAYVLPPSPFSDADRAEQQRELTDTAVAQPALGAVGAGLCSLLGRLGIRPDITAGHSYGEYVALWAAGAFTTDVLNRLSEARGRLIKTAAGDEDPGTMAAVQATPEAVTRAIGSPDGVWVANMNSPRQTVLAGRVAAIEAAIASLSTAGLSSRRLAVSCGFHSPLVQSARLGLAAVLHETPVSPLRLPVFSNMLAAPYPNAPDEIRRILSEHITSPVRFVQQIESMYAEGARVFLEVGPRAVLSGLVRDTLGQASPIVIALDNSEGSGIVQLLSVLAQLATAGVDVDFEELFRGRAAPISLARLTSPAPAQTHTWMVNGGHARRQADSIPIVATSAALMEPIHTAPLLARPTGRAAERGPSAPAVIDVHTPDRTARPSPVSQSLSSRPAFLGGAMQPDAPVTVSPSVHDSLDVMRQFQQLMSQFLQTQTLVMTTYLQGSGPPTVQAPAPPQWPQTLKSGPGLERLPAAGAATVATMVPANGNGHHQAPLATATPAAEFASPAGAEERSPAPAAAASGVATSESVLSQLVQIVSERTGYPEEMLDVDSNIEADLGIDSIKRMEILAAFQQLHPGADRALFQNVLEKLTTRKTLRETAATLGEVLGRQAVV
jgi:acyl transferase domain-containing protein/NAD(P)H-dependent flavin oxidoreductase YrpB (nitropropane dioxygenase family)